VGTALASIATGIAQGKSLDDAIKGAAPGLISAGIMSQTGLDQLGQTLKVDPKYVNVINNVAGSVIATAAKGGNGQDLINNAVAAGGGTLIGQGLIASDQKVSAANAQAIGQAIATNAVTGSTVAGATAGASSLGSSQAKANATPTPTPTPSAVVATVAGDVNTGTDDPAIIAMRQAQIDAISSGTWKSNQNGTYTRPDGVVMTPDGYGGYKETSTTTTTPAPATTTPPVSTAVTNDIAIANISSGAWKPDGYGNYEDSSGNIHFQNESGKWVAITASVGTPAGPSSLTGPTDSTGGGGSTTTTTPSTTVTQQPPLTSQETSFWGNIGAILGLGDQYDPSSTKYTLFGGGGGKPESTATAGGAGFLPFKIPGITFNSEVQQQEIIIQLNTIPDNTLTPEQKQVKQQQT
jgi:hypothetical protein